MLRALRDLKDILILAGIDLKKTVFFVSGLPFYFRTLRQMKSLVKITKAPFPFGKAYPCLEDRYRESGVVKGHYFHQDFMIARRIHDENPNSHLDIGSRLDGFVAHVAVFRQIDVMDIRPLSSNLPNIRFIQADLMKDLPEFLVESYDSMSSLHAIEHFGLGRYGDTVNPKGHLIGLSNIHRILKKGGKLYFSVPIGPQRMEFNAHRVFAIEYLLHVFSGKFNMERFSYVDDAGDLHENVELQGGLTSNFGCRFGCGIFELYKM
jgi:SAM-dependent methyltransferase